MSTDIQKVKLTDIGRLVARREELQRAVTQAKSQLRGLSQEDPDQVQREIEDAMARAVHFDKLEEEVRALQPRMSEDLRTFLRSTTASPEYLHKMADGSRWTADRYREQLTKGDDYTRLSNALADAEGALESVREQIKELRSKK